jgi:predicted nucleotidyltransferase
VDGETVLSEAVAAYRVALGDRLLAAYALGSLAHGGFSELVSDVDLGLILGDPPQPSDSTAIQEVAEAQRRKGSPLHERLSVFWGTPATLAGEREEGRFPPLDVLDLIENGRLLAGRDSARAGVRRPTTQELVIAGAEFALDQLAGIRAGADGDAHKLGSIRAAGSDALEQVRDPDLLAAQGVRQVTKLVLFPVRFLYSAATGDVGANSAAVAHYLERPTAQSSRLVDAALAWRADPPSDRAKVSELLREQLMPLYLEYIDDHIDRLGCLGRDDLAGAFAQWRGDLLARG